MKKTILTIAALLTIGFAVNAQSDSTSVPDNVTTQENSTGTTTTTVQQPVNPERVRVQANDLPASMRQTLSGNEYKGWESTPVYLNKTTNQYSFSLPNGGTSKTYTFDQSGQPVKGASSSTSSMSSSTNSSSDNAGTYSSKKTSTNSSTTGSGTNSTTTHKSSNVKRNSKPSNNSSSTTTTNSASSTSSSTPVTK